MQSLILLSIACGALAIRTKVYTAPVEAREKADESADSELDAPISDLVVMTEVNMQYIKSGLFANWVHYATPYLNKSTTLIFDCPDKEAQDAISAMTLPFEPHFIDSDFRIMNFKWKGSIKKTSDTSAFGSKSYKELMSRRPSAIQKLLAKGSSVLLVDLDTVWAKDPFQQIQLAGEHDMYLTKDNTIGLVCGCFLYFRPTEKSSKLVNTWIQTIEKGNIGSHNQGNQGALNQALHKEHGHLDVKVLPLKEFPPGPLTTQYKHATVYHANFMIGTDRKVEFLKLNKMWANANYEQK